MAIPSIRAFVYFHLIPFGESLTYVLFRCCRFSFLSFILLLLTLGFPEAGSPFEMQHSTLKSYLGPNDGAMLIDPQGKIIFSHNRNQKLIPASTLKILTALAAIHHLGPDYRFVTEFYQDNASNLKIKGCGDPLLISEILVGIADQLSPHLKSRFDVIENIIVDDSFFIKPLTIPGIISSSEPYDAPNGALCVNFNTVHFARNQKGDYISAEPQTPLLPFVLPRIRHSTLDSGRIVFSNNESDAALYAGHMFNYFLNQRDVQLSGSIKTGIVGKADKLIYRYISKYTLSQVIAMLMEYSNNFVANQILVTVGAIIYNPPGSLGKGVRVVSNYVEKILGIKDISFVEGSGISRQNRISPFQLTQILNAFAPYRELMRKTGKIYYKTGTLKGIQTRAGFIENDSGESYRFVIFINTPGKTIKKIMDRFLEMSD